MQILYQPTEITQRKSLIQIFGNLLKIEMSAVSDLDGLIINYFFGL